MMAFVRKLFCKQKHAPVEAVHTLSRAERRAQRENEAFTEAVERYEAEEERRNDLMGEAMDFQAECGIR